MICGGRFSNVLHLGFGFFLLYTAYDTVGNTQKTILDSAKYDDPSFNINAYTSMSIVNIVFAIGNWFCPSIIDIAGTRVAMSSASLTYLAFTASFLTNTSWIIYSASALAGFGASILWTSQGAYLTLNSDKSTITRNSGIFSSIFQSSMLFGNIYSYYAFEGVTHINSRIRQQFTYVMIAICVAGVLLLSTLRPPKTAQGEVIPIVRVGSLRAMRDALKVLKRPEMLLILPLFLYLGFFLAFSVGVHSPSIGATLNLGDSAKSLVGLSGCVMGGGQITASLLISILGNRHEKWGRVLILSFGLLTHLVTFILICLNLPNSSSFGDTHDHAYFKSNGALAVACSGTLGFGSSFFYNVVYSTLGTVYRENASASSGSAAAFLYSSYLGLHAQIAILSVAGLLSVFTYALAEYRTIRKPNSLSTQKSCINGRSTSQALIHAGEESALVTELLPPRN